MKPVDLRSDTVTLPTDAMRKAMAEANLGDDVYGEDPTVRRLEELAAEMLGKEAALLVTSGTQGNQVAVATHVSRGEEVIVEAESHIFMYEVAGVSVIAGAQARQVRGRKGVLQPEDVQGALRGDDIHQPRTGLICIENTHNRAGGTVTPLATLRAIRGVAEAVGVPIHMDGARLFNAVVASGHSAKEITACVDTVQFCLSKGLSAPVGSVLVGPRGFIDEARVWRKRLGGGLRQAGVIAAPGIVALTTMVDRLAEDHEHARLLASRLAEINGISVDVETVQTNIVIVNISGTGIDVNRFVTSLRNKGVFASVFGPTHVRFVTHKDVSRDDILVAVDIITRELGALSVV